MNDPRPYVIANLKANKTWDEIIVWLDQVGKSASTFLGTVIVCPPHPFLASCYQKIKKDKLKIKLACQDLSKFEQGPYTGEFAASQIANMCAYSICGHSERRQNFTEDEDTIAKKVKNAKESAVEPILCVQDTRTLIPDGVTIVAYEPIFAVGTGNPDNPDNAKSTATKLKAKGNYVVVYGGSVSSDNVASFLQKDVIDGVLVGFASLDPWEFTEIIEAAKY